MNKTDRNPPVWCSQPAGPRHALGLQPDGSWEHPSRSAPPTSDPWPPGWSPFLQSILSGEICPHHPRSVSLPSLLRAPSASARHGAQEVETAALSTGGPSGNPAQPSYPGVLLGA